MTNKEKIIKRIQELVPEIMELKTGCRFTENGRDYLIVTERHKTVDGMPFDIGAVEIGKEDDGIQWFASEYIEEQCTILGRPITLEDVLVAMGKIDENAPMTLVPCDSNVLKTNGIRGKLAIRYNYDEYCWWILGNPLHLQSEELINYLTDILCRD